MWPKGKGTYTAPHRTIIVDKVPHSQKVSGGWDRYRCVCGDVGFNRDSVQHKPVEIMDKAVKHNLLAHRGEYTIRDMRFGDEAAETLRQSA